MRVVASRDAAGPLIGLGLVAALIGAAAATLAPDIALILPRLLPFLAIALGTIILHRRVGLGLLSPVAILIASYVAIALLGPLVADVVATGRLGAPISLSASESQGAYLIIVTAVGAVVIGALIQSFVARRSAPVGGARVPFKTPGRSVRVAAAAFCFATLGLQVVAYGSDIFSRAQYLPTRAAGDAILAAAQGLALPALAVLGWLCVVSETRRAKLLSFAGSILFGIILFSAATRAFALIPIIFALGVLAARPESSGARILLIAAVLSSQVLLQVPLALRGLSMHGLVPYLQALSSGLTLLDPQAVAATTVVAFQLTGHVAFAVAPLSPDSLVVSFDPRPGAWTDWYLIRDDLRLNIYTPYNALGELANHGWFLLVTFFAVVGFYLNHVGARIRRLLADGQGPLGLLLFGLACFFVVQSLEYNLRASVRIIYYMMAFEVAISIVRRITRIPRPAQNWSLAALPASASELRSIAKTPRLR